jgi:hypothetical protein
VRDDAPNLKTEDGVMCWLVRAVTYLRGMVIDEYGAMME